jgi:hypothetical protein
MYNRAVQILTENHKLNFSPLDVFRINVAIILPQFPSCIVHSREAEVQYQREMGLLSVHYLNPRSIPDSPAEPDDFYEPPTIPSVIPLDKPGMQPVRIQPPIVPNIAQLSSTFLTQAAANPSYLSALLQQQPIGIQQNLNWGQFPMQNVQSVPNVPIPSVFQTKYQPYANPKAGQPPIPSRGRAGIPKSYRGKN